MSLLAHPRSQIGEFLSRSPTWGPGQRNPVLAVWIEVISGALYIPKSRGGSVEKPGKESFSPLWWASYVLSPPLVLFWLYLWQEKRRSQFQREALLFSIFEPVKGSILEHEKGHRNPGSMEGHGVLRAWVQSPLDHRMHTLQHWANL